MDGKRSKEKAGFQQTLSEQLPFQLFKVPNMGGGGCYHCNYLWTSNATVILIFISFCSLQDQFKLGGGGGRVGLVQ